MNMTMSASCLDGAGFAEVGELRDGGFGHFGRGASCDSAMTGMLSSRAMALRPRVISDFLHAVVRAHDLRVHELQVVDHEQAEAFSICRRRALGAHVHDGRAAESSM